VLLARLGQPVQLVLGQVLGEPVALVVGEPQLAGLGMEVEAHRVAHATGDDLHAAAVQVDPSDVRILVGRRITDVARRADRHVQLAVGPDLDELPAVGHVAGELVVDRDGIARLVELGLDVVLGVARYSAPLWNSIPLASCSFSRRVFTSRVPPLSTIA
jgi:hypothetical protein